VGRPPKPVQTSCAPTLWRRIKDHGIRVGADPELGSVLGRLSLFGELNDSQVEAGRYYAKLVATFERESGCPRRTVASPQYDRAYKSGSAVMETAHPEWAARMKSLQRKMDRTESVLYDPRMRRAVEEVCCNDHEISSLDYPSLRAGLTALANYWKLPGKNRTDREGENTRSSRHRP
jgi:hypothetical protein